MTTGVLDQGRPLAELLSSTPLAHSSASRDKIVELLTQRLPQAADLVRERVAAVGVLLNWLEAFPGDDWQTRWEFAGADYGGADWGPPASRRAVCRGVTALVVLDVVRPQPSWFARATPAHLFVAYRRLHEPDTFDRLQVAIVAEDATRTSGMIALNTLTRVRLHIGVDLLEVDPAGFSRVVEAYRATGRRLVAVELAWRALQAVGGLVGAPATRRAAEHQGPADAAGLIDRYQIECRAVRDLLVEYLREREPSVDHSTLTNLAMSLASRFWRDLELHHPGISDLRLDPDVAAAWKQRLRYGPDGTFRRGSNTILMAVRSFYLDIAHWALNDPGRWTLWAAPSPVTAADTAGVKKQHRRQQAEMRQRTRTLAPLLPALIATAERRHHDARCLHDTAQSAAVGQRFDVAGIGYERIARWSHYSDGDRRPAVRRLPDDAIVQTFQREDETFWAWAIVEVLRHTGIRSEELLELTHLSIRRYTQPDGEVIPLMQVAPSKTDAERVLPVAPELASVLARVITRITRPRRRRPARRPLRRPTNVARLRRMPHLFQRRFGGTAGRHQPDGPSATCSTGLADDADLTDVDGRPVRFTPHDFRRIFATEAVNRRPPRAHRRSSCSATST